MRVLTHLIPIVIFCAHEKSYELTKPGQDVQSIAHLLTFATAQVSLHELQVSLNELLCI